MQQAVVMVLASVLAFRTQLALLIYVACSKAPKTCRTRDDQLEPLQGALETSCSLLGHGFHYKPDRKFRCARRRLHQIHKVPSLCRFLVYLFSVFPTVGLSEKCVGQVAFQQN